MLKTIKIKTLFVAAAMLIMAAACKDPLEEATPEVLQINPEKFASEPGTAHSIQFKVSCDKAFTPELEDTPWASIGETTDKGSGAYQLTVNLEANTGAENRTGTLKLVAGKKSVTASFIQLPISKLLSFTEVKLVNLQGTSVSVKLPEKWTLSCTEENGTPAEWFSADATSGIANLSKTISFKGNSINLTDAPRKGWAVFTFSETEIKVPVNQAVTDILGPDCGVFNYDGKGGSIVLNPVKHQVSKLTKADGTRDFRMLSPFEDKFIVWMNLPASYAKGDKVPFFLCQNWVSAIGYQSDVEAEVVKVDDKLVWLVAGEVCYVIRK